MTQTEFESHIGSEQHKSGGKTTNIQQQLPDISSLSIAHSESFHSTDGAESIKSQSSFTIGTDLVALIATEANDLLTRKNQRIQFEKEIVAMVCKRVKLYNSRFHVHQYGSTTYGFGGSSDLNILVDTCRFSRFTIIFISNKYDIHRKSLFSEN